MLVILDEAADLLAATKGKSGEDRLRATLEGDQRQPLEEPAIGALGIEPVRPAVGLGRGFVTVELVGDQTEVVPDGLELGQLGRGAPEQVECLLELARGQRLGAGLDAGHLPTRALEREASKLQDEHRVVDDKDVA